MTAIAQHPPLTSGLLGFAAFGTLSLLLVLAPSLVLSPAAREELPGPAPRFTPGDLDEPALSTYAIIAEHPLFNARREKDAAPAPVPGTAPALPALSEYRLAGVVLSSSTKLALVERVASKQIVTLKPGDMLDGRKVDDIVDGSIVLSAAGASETLAIPHVDGWSRTAIPAATATQVPK